MRRALILGVAAALGLLGFPSPSQAAGVTRSAPFDFGLQCLTRDTSFAVVIGGTGLPYGCDTVPDPVAMTGQLRTFQHGVAGSASVREGGFSVVGGVAHSTVGRKWSAAGLNVNSGPGGKLTASAQASATVCISIAYGGSALELARSCGSNPSASVSAGAGTNYSIQVTLHDRAPSTVSAPGPCPPGVVVTCSTGVALSSSDNAATLSSITYSIG